MSRTRILLCIAFALVLLPGFAAADDDGFSRSGPYIGIGGVYTQNGLIEDEFDDALPSGVDVDVDDSAGVNAVVGYRMLPWLAGELQYEYVDGYDVTAVSGPLKQTIEIKSHVLTANLKAIVPIWRVHPYLLVGAGMVRWEFDEKGNVPGGLVSDGETDFAGRAGAGVDVYLTRNIVLNAGANVVLSNTTLGLGSIPGGDDVDFLFYTVAGGSLQYRF